MQNRRKKIRLVSFIVSLVFCLTVWGVTTSVKLSNARISIEQSNQRALTQLGTHLDDIALNLKKSAYANSENMLSEIAVDLWRSSASAKENLSEITNSNTEISKVYKFLSQVGEYTLALNKRLANGEKISAEEITNTEKLLKLSESLSQKVNSLIKSREDGLLSFDEVKSTLTENNAEAVDLGSSLNDANQSIADYPTLIYDGPFSDHIANKKSALLEGEKTVSEEKAREIAGDFVGLRGEKVTLLSKTEGNMALYTFYNGDYTIGVTQRGGYVSYMLTSRYVSEIQYSQKQAVKKATEFLKEKGYTKVKESYYSTNDGICTVNFSFYEGGVTYYTDLIKVSVALDDGEITAFDATGYLMNHTKREVPRKTKYTLKQGEKLLRENLKVISRKKAFIPTEWETEEYVYEYHCSDKNGDHVLVYIDPLTGWEKDILLMLYVDGGVLTK